MTATVAALRFDGLVAGHGRRALTNPLTLEFESGLVHAIIGRNGSGKTTLLRTAIGLHDPLAGKVNSVVPVSYVPQLTDFEASVPVSALEVVAMGRPLGERWSVRRRRARETLASIGLETEATRRFFELSGGQRQRVLLARALCADARLLALDEPTSGVDIDAVELVWTAIRELTQRGCTVLMVTHDLLVLPHVADRTWVLVERELRLREGGDAT
ncbi:MAG: ATP-binding cassette domain-containing protein [Planctomycetes bacterium]|nr:ATP-binding cassette domain-containing protein [Planctomycetota bacterium]